MTESSSRSAPASEIFWWIVLGVVLGLIGLGTYQYFRTPSPNLKVVLDQSVRGRVGAVVCSVDALGNADAQGIVRDVEHRVLKIGADFSSGGAPFSASDSGPVYTYFDSGDPDLGEDSGVLGFSVVAPADILQSRPTTCTISVISNYAN